MSCIGEDKFAVCRKPGRLAGGETLTASEDPIERLEDFPWAMLRSSTQSSHEHRHIHCRLQPFASDVADDNEQPAIWCRLHMKEVSTDFVCGAVDRIDLEARSCELFMRNHELLHTAGGRQLA